MSCTADHIAHHPHVRRQGQLLGAKALHHLDTQRVQLIAHRRVHPDIAPRHPVSRLPRQGSQPAHKRAADAQYMNMHQPILPATPLKPRTPAVARILGKGPAMSSGRTKPTFGPRR